MASSSHFFLQISARSMQRGGGGKASYTHRPPGSSSHESFLPAQVTPALHPAPCPPHPLGPVPIGNTFHSWRGRPTRERSDSGGERRRGRGSLRPPGRPRGAAGGGGKNTAVPNRPRGEHPAGRGVEGRGGGGGEDAPKGEETPQRG